MPIKRFPFLICLSLLFSCKPKPPDPPPTSQKIFEAPKNYPAFSGKIAFEYLKKQITFGPRVPGSKSHQDCLQYLHAELNKYSSVRLQEFMYPGYDGAQMKLTNIIASFYPEAKKRILLCAHWDSRPRADQDSLDANKSKPIPGANDGASGVSILLALAQMLHAAPPPIGVDVVLFDGEDYGKESDLTMYCIGSKYFSASVGKNYKPMFGILLDLVGDKNARFPKEDISVRYAPSIVDLIWSSAKLVGAVQFIDEAYGEIYDDHHSLNTTAGIPTVDIIDADLVGHKSADVTRKYWHTLDDKPAHCSPSTLENVGRVLTYLIYGLLPS